MKTSTLTIAASVIISVFVSGLVTTQMVTQHAETKREFKVVDVNALSDKLMEQLEKNLSENDAEMNPEMVKFIAQQEAKKLYTQIALHDAGRNIVLPKQSVIYVPQEYDITQNISDELGLGDIGKTGLNRLVDKDGE